jgi:hypothetical protein
MLRGEGEKSLKVCPAPPIKKLRGDALMAASLLTQFHAVQV